MNITEYVSIDESAQIYNGKISLKPDYHIDSADEAIYKYLGGNSVLPLTSLLHADDVKFFNDAVEDLDKGPQHLIVRLLGYNKKYRYMYMIMEYNNRSVQERRCINAELLDIVYIHNRYNTLRGSVDKYRLFMSLSSNIYVEYFYEDKLVNVFEYFNRRGHVIFRKNIEEMKQDVLYGGAYSEGQKVQFMSFYDSLTCGIQSNDLYIDGALFGMKGSLCLNAGALNKNGRQHMLVAVAKPIKGGDVEKNEKYYMTEYGIDSALGIYNKRAISELATDLIRDGEKKPLYIVMMDIDNFKSLNDVYGHLTGDMVLEQVAGCIVGVIGDRGYAGRFGGDEFFIITDKIKNDSDIVVMIKAIRKQISWNCRQEIPGMNVTCSVGICKFPDDGKTYDELFRIADKCLYIAKAKGRDRYILYNPALHGTVEDGSKNSSGIDVMMWNNSYQMCGFAYGIISELYNGGKAEIQKCLDMIKNNFDLDGIAIYKGDDYKRIAQTGEYFNPIENASFIGETEFSGCFDQYGVLCTNKTFTIKEKCQSGYDCYMKQNTSAFLLVKTEDDKGKIAISFDIFNRMRKWSDYEKGILMLIAKYIMEVCR